MLENGMDGIQLLRVPEVAAALGVGRSFVYRLVERGELPVIRIGEAAVRFDPADVRALIARRRVKREVEP
jgi:excisionase family DNA binding protein